MIFFLAFILLGPANERTWVVQSKGEASFGVTLPQAWTPSVVQGKARAGTGSFRTADGGRLDVSFTANARPNMIKGFLDDQPRTVRKRRAVLVVRRFVRGGWQGEVSTLRPVSGHGMKLFTSVKMLKGRTAKILAVTTPVGAAGLSEAAAIRICERVGL